jgi:hypothetical protein
MEDDESVYMYQDGDADALVSRLGPHFTPFAEPMDVQLAVHDDPVWGYLRVDLQLAANKLLRLELDEDPRNSTRVSLGEMQPFGQSFARIKRLPDDERRLWKKVLPLESTPPGMAVAIRDYLLSSGTDASPLNADEVIKGYRHIAQGPDESLYVTFALLRANTIARSRKLTVEADIRQELLLAAEKCLTVEVPPGISLRLLGALAEPPRNVGRAQDEILRITTLLNHIESKYRDASTIDWVAQHRILVAGTDLEREHAQHLHVQQYLDLSASDEVPLRAMHWAESAARLATNYGAKALHESAVIRMQKLSRGDLKWERIGTTTTLPSALFRHRERRMLKMSSWEQAMVVFLSSGSPAGHHESNKRKASGLRRGLLDLFGGRTFGSHQLPERTRGSAEEEQLASIVQTNLAGAALLFRIDLDAIESRFGTPNEDRIIAALTTLYDSPPELVRLFAQALRLYWLGDPSGTSRLVIPLVEASARELLFMMDQPLYRTERGASPGRFPAMDFYIESLERLNLDPDWAQALRGTLLSTGMNLRNRLAHGFQMEFSSAEAALLIRLAGLFIAMPIGTGAIQDERVRTPLAFTRIKLHRRLAVVWR